MAHVPISNIAHVLFEFQTEIFTPAQMLERLQWKVESEKGFFPLVRSFSCDSIFSLRYSGKYHFTLQIAIKYSHEHVSAELSFFESRIFLN
jgi:hypothetical protein